MRLLFFCNVENIELPLVLEEYLRFDDYNHNV